MLSLKTRHKADTTGLHITPRDESGYYFGGGRIIVRGLYGYHLGPQEGVAQVWDTSGVLGVFCKIYDSLRQRADGLLADGHTFSVHLLLLYYIARLKGPDRA